MAVPPNPVIIPGPTPLPIIGKHGNFVLQFLRDPINYMNHVYKRYGPIAGLTKNDPGAVFAFGPEYNRQFLANADIYHIRGSLLFPAPEDSAPRQLDAGLTNMNGDKHRQQRRLMMPAFQRKHVETYCEDMVTITQHFLDRWRPGENINLSREMQMISLYIANKTLLGFDAIKNPRKLDIAAMIKRWQEMITSPLVIGLPFDRPGMPYRRALKHAEAMVAFLRKTIADKRANPDEQHDVLANLIKARDEDGTAMTDVELIGQATLLFAAGHETTGNSLIWTLILLAQHPNVMHDLLDELDQVLGGAAPTVEQLNKLPLLDKVIKESLRLFPTVFMSARKATQPFQLGPYELPEGMTVIFSEYMTHRMPELFPEPNRFLPERWNTIDPSPYEYLPFSTGARMCPGATFAMTELRIILAMTLQRYRLALIPGTVIKRQMAVTLSAKSPIPATVHKQDRRFSQTWLRGNLHEVVDLNY
ncbi:MAG: cytochrome P450 [Herpetosiphonaceae bacterium]|nr:cytochrome P450 [Herpetosiphonaceae bacterium]